MQVASGKRTRSSATARHQEAARLGALQLASALASCAGKLDSYKLRDFVLAELAALAHPSLSADSFPRSF